MQEICNSFVIFDQFEFSGNTLRIILIFILFNSLYRIIYIIIIYFEKFRSNKKKMNMIYIIYIILTAHGGQKIDQPIQQHVFIV